MSVLHTQHTALRVSLSLSAISLSLSLSLSISSYLLKLPRYLPRYLRVQHVLIVVPLGDGEEDGEEGGEEERWRLVIMRDSHTQYYNKHARAHTLTAQGTAQSTA